MNCCGMMKIKKKNNGKMYICVTFHIQYLCASCYIGSIHFVRRWRNMRAYFISLPSINSIFVIVYRLHICIYMIAMCFVGAFKLCITHTHIFSSDFSFALIRLFFSAILFLRIEHPPLCTQHIEMYFVCI